ncbi:MAG: VCBS repeat-containing protein, partial [Planctomycetota bacterium]
VIGGENSSTMGLVWYQYPTWTKRTIAAGNFTTDGKCADMDGDGDIDVITCNIGKGVFWYENPNDVKVTTWKAHQIDSSYAHDIEVGDIDGDKRPDVLTCSKKELLLHLQQSDGSFSTRSLLSSSGEGIALADMDRDGDLDLLFGASWLQTPADPTKDAFKQYTVTSFGSDTRVRAADLDQDGDLDMVLCWSEGTGPLIWVEAPKDPTATSSWKTHTIEGSLEKAHSLQVGDLDGDGLLDIVTAQMHTSKDKRVMYYQQAKGMTWVRHLVAVTGSHNLQIGDIANDGDLDLVGKNYDGPFRVVELWVNHMGGRGQ